MPVYVRADLGATWSIFGQNIFLESKIKSHLILSQQLFHSYPMLFTSGVFCALTLFPLFLTVCFTLGVRPNKYLRAQNCEPSYAKYQIITKMSAPDPESKWKAFSEKAAGQVVTEIDILVGQIALCIVST